MGSSPIFRSYIKMVTLIKQSYFFISANNEPNGHACMSIWLCCFILFLFHSGLSSRQLIQRHLKNICNAYQGKNIRNALSELIRGDSLPPDIQLCRQSSERYYYRNYLKVSGLGMLPALLLQLIVLLETAVYSLFIGGRDRTSK